MLEKQLVRVPNSVSTKISNKIYSIYEDILSQLEATGSNKFEIVVPKDDEPLLIKVKVKKTKKNTNSTDSSKSFVVTNKPLCKGRHTVVKPPLSKKDVFRMTYSIKEPIYFNPRDIYSYIKSPPIIPMRPRWNIQAQGHHPILVNIPYFGRMIQYEVIETRYNFAGEDNKPCKKYNSSRLPIANYSSLAKSPSIIVNMPQKSTPKFQNSKQSCKSFASLPGINSFVTQMTRSNSYVVNMPKSHTNSTKYLNSTKNYSSKPHSKSFANLPCMSKSQLDKTNSLVDNSSGRQSLASKIPRRLSMSQAATPTFNIHLVDNSSMSGPNSPIPNQFNYNQKPIHLVESAPVPSNNDNSVNPLNGFQIPGQQNLSKSQYKRLLLSTLISKRPHSPYARAITGPPALPDSINLFINTDELNTALLNNLSSQNPKANLSRLFSSGSSPLNSQPNLTNYALKPEHFDYISRLFPVPLSIESCQQPQIEYNIQQQQQLQQQQLQQQQQQQQQQLQQQTQQYDYLMQPQQQQQQFNYTNQQQPQQSYDFNMPQQQQQQQQQNFYPNLSFNIPMDQNNSFSLNNSVHNTEYGNAVQQQLNMNNLNSPSYNLMGLMVN